MTTEPQQLSFDFSDEQPTRERMPRTFVGTTSADLCLDPNEFAGMSVPAITEEIKSMLRGIAPDADFFEQDIVEAAAALHTK